MALQVIEGKGCSDGCNAIPDSFMETPSGTREQRLDAMRSYTEKIGYRFVGKHSAIKVCSWTKHAIKNDDFCYKKKFYGIESSQCVQMTPVMFFCSFNCLHCWRNFDYMLPKDDEWDEPESIVNGCVAAQRKMLSGYGGNPKSDKDAFKKANDPKHFAISLSGEPTMYPRLPEFIDAITSRSMTAFLVSNGTYPEMIERLLAHEPTNLYISFYGTNPKMYKRTTAPMLSDYWERVMKSMSLLKNFGCNTVMRLTLAKSLNFTDPEGYAAYADKYAPKYVEVKAYMAVGGSRKALDYTDMPTHQEISEFAAKIEKSSSYRIVDEKPNSRVILLAR